MWPNPQETADLVAFTEKILNGKLHFLGSVHSDWVEGRMDNELSLKTVLDNKKILEEVYCH